MTRQKRRKYIRRGIPAIIIFGLLIAGIFWWIYGWMMLLRYLLGALLFATITVTLIAILRKMLGNKVFKLW